MSSVKPKLEGAEVGVEGGRGEGGGGGGVGGDVHSDSSDSEMVGPPLPPGYKVLNEQNDVRQKREPELTLWFLLNRFPL